jgi:creatinine amidohydrolase/Fe(II)-dependent formamide hydrolase-like protein
MTLSMDAAFATDQRTSRLELMVRSTSRCMGGAAALVVALTAPRSGAAQTRAPEGPPYIEAMTWTEVRDAIQAGKKAVIVPTGGTEQNGPHMILGKHNYIVTYAAGLLAERLGNALVAPTIQYVPEGDYRRPSFAEKPGVITNPSPAYDLLLDAAARSLKVHGFTDILLIGDSGGNQEGLTKVATSLNAEWAGSGVRVFALVDYYQQGRVQAREWLLETHGLDAATVGSHAGTSDTSQLLYVHPAGIRRDKLAPGGGSLDSGVNGDPTKATAEIGRVIIDLKVNAAVKQYESLKATTQPN